jgi:hypothetical protein
MAVSTGLFSGLLAELFVGAPRVRRPWVDGSDLAAAQAASRHRA